MAEQYDGFDLTALDTRTASNEGVEVEIKHPVTGDGTGFFITVLGEDSDAFRKVQSAQSQRKIKMAVKRRGPIEVTTEEIEDDALSLLSACTKSWRMAPGKPVEFRGQPFPCNRDNAATLYSELPVVRRQIEEEIRNQANFTKRSAPH